MFEESFWSPDDLVVPVIHDLGGFVPLMCCLCGHLLRTGRHTFQEGTICGSCRFLLAPIVKAQLAASCAEKRGEQ